MLAFLASFGINHFAGGQLHARVQVRLPGNGILGPLNRQGKAAPNQHDHGHHRGYFHDPERLITGLMDAENVLAEEIERDAASNDDRSHFRVTVAKLKIPETHLRIESRAAHFDDAKQQAHDIRAGGDAARGSGQNEVKHQGGDREFGQESAHGFLDDLIAPAAHEETTALDVHRADAVAEDHHGEDEPRRGRTDRLLNDAANVVGGAGQVTEHNRGRPPIRNEGEHHAADDDDLRRLQRALITTGRLGRGGVARHGKSGSGDG